jgi:hypothetical protein
MIALTVHGVAPAEYRPNLQHSAVLLEAGSNLGELEVQAGERA